MFTYKDTAVITPNSDTPYSLMEVDLRAEPVVISVPAVPKPRYYSVQLTDANTFNYGYMGSRSTGTEAGDYLVVGPDWKGEPPPAYQASLPFHHAILGNYFPHPAVRCRRYAQRGQNSGRLQSAAALFVSQAGPASPAAGD